MPRISLAWAIVLGMLTAIGPICTDLYLPALPDITRQLSATTTLTQLSLTASLLGLGLGQLFFGPLSDRLGRKRPLMLSLLLFILSSVLCATTQDIHWLIFWRFIQGLAGAGGSVLSRAIARDKYHGTLLTQFFCSADDGKRHCANRLAGTRRLYRLYAALARAVLDDGGGWRGITALQHGGTERDIVGEKQRRRAAQYLAYSA